MRKTSEFKAMAKERIYPRLSPLVGAVLIFGGIFIGLAVIVAIVYTTQLIAQGVFASEESMIEYMTSMYDVQKSSITDTVMSYIIELIIGALLATLQVGFMDVCLKVARNENVKSSDIFSVYKKNPDRIILIYFAGFVAKFVCMLPTYISDYFVKGQENNPAAMITSFGINIVCIILQICVTVLISQAYFIYIDNPDQNSIVSVKQSVELMSRRPCFAGYLMLMISFIPWYIVIACTFGFAVLWVLPFMNVSYALFYMNLKGELGTKIDTVV